MAQGQSKSLNIHSIKSIHPIENPFGLVAEENCPYMTFKHRLIVTGMWMSVAVNTYTDISNSNTNTNTCIHLCICLVELLGKYFCIRVTITKALRLF